MPSSYRTELGGRRGRGYACPGARRWYEPNDQAVDWLLLLSEQAGASGTAGGTVPAAALPDPVG